MGYWVRLGSQLIIFRWSKMRRPGDIVWILTREESEINVAWWLYDEWIEYQNLLCYFKSPGWSTPNKKACLRLFTLNRQGFFYEALLYTGIASLNHHNPLIFAIRKLSPGWEKREDFKSKKKVTPYLLTSQMWLHSLSLYKKSCHCNSDEYHKRRPITSLTSRADQKKPPTFPDQAILKKAHLPPTPT